MTQQTRTFYVDQNGYGNSNADMCSEIASSAHFDNLANSNLPLKNRGAKGDRKVRITIKVETEKKLSPAQNAAAEIKRIDELVKSLSSAGWEHLLELSTQKAREDIRARAAKRDTIKVPAAD